MIYVHICPIRIKSDSTTSPDLVGLRNSACATAFDRLRNSQECTTLLLQLRWPDCATLFPQTIPAHIELENDTCRPQEQDVIKIPTLMELQTDLECPQG